MACRPLVMPDSWAIVKPSRLLWGLLVAAATAAVLLSGAKIPRGFWEENRGLFYGGVAILAITALLEVVRPGLQDRRLALERRVREVLKAALLDIVESTGLDWRRLGVHAFLVRRTWRHPFRGVLRRVGRERLSSSPPASGIEWTRGKGALGRCWAEMRDVGVNLEVEWGSLRGSSRKDWEEASDEVKYGMSFEEFQRVRDYGAIVVTPILDSREGFRGCVSVDAPGDVYEVLWSRDVREILQDAAQTIWGALTPLREEY
jgi:hypothetical protein